MFDTNTKNNLQVFEHQTIRVGEIVSDMLFTKEIWQALAIFNEKHKSKYYQLVYQGVKFGHYVGIIQIGRFTIEILPKIDQLDTRDANTWQKVLIDMLQYCNLLKVTSLGYGNTQLKTNSLLHLYIAQFLNATEQYIQTGIQKKYLPEELNTTCLKGQLLVPKQLRYNQFTPTHFYVRAHRLQEEHVLNQLIYEALKVIKEIYLPSTLQGQLTTIFSRFPKIASYNWSPKDFTKLLRQRNTETQQKLIELTQLIVMNSSSDIRYGQHSLMALLFDMNMLFEEYIFQQIKRAAGKDIKVSRQTSIPFWQRRIIRPDILIEIAGEKIVLDTKWILLANKSPAIADLKQMYIYCRYFKATKGILLYPWAGSTPQTITQPYLDGAENIDCQLQFLNVLDEVGQLKRNIGKEILREVQNLE